MEKRENTRCLNCNSLERHRLLWKYLTEKTNNLDGKNFKMLHFAPQRMFLKKFSKHPNIDYTPCDINPETYEYFDIHKIEKVDVLNIPYNDNSYDIVMCNHVLEYVEDYLVGISELYRVMKQGGWGIFQVPIDFSRETTSEDKSIINPKEYSE